MFSPITVPDFSNSAVAIYVNATSFSSGSSEGNVPSNQIIKFWIHIAPKRSMSRVCSQYL